MKNHFFIIIIVSVFLIGFSSNSIFAEEYIVEIPFGAYNPELNTPAEVWYDPPVILISEGDTVIWYNKDREGHTVTSGKGSGRFGWMSDDFGSPDGIFHSDRFMPEESWNYKFENSGTFSYYCTIHPWMDGIIIVEQLIPDYPHDAFGNKIDEFPIIRYTPDQMLEVNLSWEPRIIKTDEKVQFVYQFYDTSTNSNLANMGYEFIIIQNGNEIYRDSGKNQIGGDYRNFAFEEAGPVIIRLEGIQSAVSIAEESTIVRGTSENKQVRTVEYSTKVYENTEKKTLQEFDIKPANRLEFYYELAMAIILIPAGIFAFIIVWMKKGAKKSSSYVTPI